MFAELIEPRLKSLVSESIMDPRVDNRLRLQTEILLNVARQVLSTNSSACKRNFVVCSPKTLITVAYDGCSWVINLWNSGLVGARQRH
jgi:hypothetical protein